MDGVLRLKTESADVTVPPAPDCVTERTNVCMKVADTERSALIVTVHVPVPEHPEPDQPEKRQPDAAVAVNVTDVPVSYVAVAEPAATREIPEGLDETEPLPTWVAERTYVLMKVAVTGAYSYFWQAHGDPARGPRQANRHSCRASGAI